MNELHIVCIPLINQFNQIKISSSEVRNKLINNFKNIIDKLF